MKVKIFDLVSYVSLFLYLLASSFVRIYNNPAFKLALPLIIGVVGLHYFLKGDKANYFKLGIVVLLLGHNANQYFYTLLTLFLFNSKIILPAKGLVAYIYLLFFSGLISYIINQFVEWNPLSFPFFIASFFLTLIFFLLAYRYVNLDIKNQLVNFYIGVVLILAVVAILENLTTGHTVDSLTGGTTSSHTLGFHMAVGFIYSSTKFLNRTLINKRNLKEILLLLLSVPVMYLADAKYLLLNSIISISIIYLLFYSNKLVRPVLIVAIIISFFFTLDFLKTTKINISTKVSFSYMEILEKLTLGAKYRLVEETFKLPKNEPMIFFIGSGPGTFLSRAANSRAFDTMNKKSGIGGGQSVAVESKLPSFIPAHTTWVTHKYATQYFNKIWYGTLFDFRSSMISFIWEFGLLGCLLFSFLFFSINRMVMRAKRHLNYLAHHAFFIQSFIIFYLLNSLLAYYFEYPETQILFWMFLGAFSSRKLTTT